MSILLRLKNKLHDPSSYETKIREFDECISLLRNENIELHKRIDQLEIQCKNDVHHHQTHFLHDYIRQLEQENGRLATENKIQREEYERFLERLTPMVLRTAMMQENIRQECASIFRVIERLSILTANSIEDKCVSSFDFETCREKCSSLENIYEACSDTLNQEPSPKFNRYHRQISEPSIEKRTMKILQAKPSISFQSKALPSCSSPSTLQRSETFIISKLPSIDCATQTNISCHRPSKLPTRRSNLTASSKTNVSPPPPYSSRSIGTDKTSKLPIRTSGSLSKQSNALIKSNTVTSVKNNPKKDTATRLDRATPIPNGNNVKKPVRVISTVSSSAKSRTTIAVNSNKRSSSSKEPVASSSMGNHQYAEDQMNSTSSDSSIETQLIQHEKRINVLQDEGYSTWSSTDVKEERIEQSLKSGDIDEKSKTIGLVKHWLDASKRSEDLPNQLAPNNSLQRSNQALFHGSSLSDPLKSSETDRSIDSLEKAESHDIVSTFSLSSSSSSSSPSSSSSGFSRSETFERILLSDTLAQITEAISDSTSTASSAFNMSAFIEDKMIEPSISTDSSSTEQSIIDTFRSCQPEKRLMLPGLLNRLVFLRRVVSDSDLKANEYCINEDEDRHHVYHSNKINEHSVEVNLINTYGSDSELQVWSHDCAEQRRFTGENCSAMFRMHEEIDDDREQLARERQHLLQQIYEYPWLLKEQDLEGTSGTYSKTDDQVLLSPMVDVNVPLPNPDFYQLCPLTHSGSFVISSNQNFNVKSNAASTSLM